MARIGVAKVEAPNVVEAVEAHFKRFLAIDSDLPLVMALWSLGTHLYPVFDAYPYLGITSPTKRCGKTRTAEVLELFCARPLRTVGMTSAVLFRSIEQDHPTLMIDEAEGLRGTDERVSTLREVLNAGYRVGQKVRRCDPNGFAIKEFETFCPKVLVLIGNLPDTLADRTIAIRMRRRYAGEDVDRFIVAHAKRESARVRQACQQWAAKHQSRVRQAYEGADLKFIEDREAELWVPLFSVCRVAAPSRIGDLERIARCLAGAKSADEPGDTGIRLLADIRDIFEAASKDRMNTSELLLDLNGIDSAPWADFCHGKPLNPRALSGLLRPFGISPQNIRTGAAVGKGYTLDSFKEAFARYLPPPPATPLQGP